MQNSEPTPAGELGSVGDIKHHTGKLTDAINRFFDVDDDFKKYKVEEAHETLSQSSDDFNVDDLVKLSIIEHAFDFVDRDSSGILNYSELCVGIEILLPTIRSSKVYQDDAKRDPTKEALHKLDIYLNHGEFEKVKMEESVRAELGTEDELGYMDLKVFITYVLLKEIVSETTKALDEDGEYTLADLRNQFILALKLLMKKCGIPEPSKSSIRRDRFIALILQYLASVEQIYEEHKKVESSWLLTRLFNRIYLVLTLPLIGAYYALKSMGYIGDRYWTRCKCSSRGFFRGLFLLIGMPLVAGSIIICGFGSIATIILYHISIAEGVRGGCSLSPLEGYLPFLLFILLSDVLRGIIYEQDSEEDRPFTSVYFDKTVALWESIDVLRVIHTTKKSRKEKDNKEGNADGRKRHLPIHREVKKIEKTSFEMIEYLKSKTESVSHYQIILSVFGILTAIGHAFIPGIFRVSLGYSFACNPSDPVNVSLVSLYVVVSLFAVSGLLISLSALIEKSLDAQQELYLAGALLDPSKSRKVGLKCYLHIRNRKNLLGWMLIRDYLIKSFQANTKTDGAIVNPLALYMIVMLVVVFIRLILDQTIDILVVLGTWDVIAISIYILVLLFPALYTNNILKIEHPTAVRAVKWQIKKGLNQEVIEKEKIERYLENSKSSEGKAQYNSEDLEEVSADVTQKQAHIELMEAALIELTESDIEAKLLGFPVTESVLVQLATVMGTGISAISAKLSDTSVQA